MQAAEAMVGLVHSVATLRPITEPVAIPAREQLSGAIDLRDPPAAMDAIGEYVADEPGTFSAEAAGRPSDRHALRDRLPFLPTCLEAIFQVMASLPPVIPIVAVVPP